MRLARKLALLLLLAAIPTSVWAQREPPVPKELLERLAAAADDFVARYQNFAAEETLVQRRWARNGRVERERQIVCDYVVLRLPSARGRGRELVELRDVIAVDGKESQSLEKRNEKWARFAASHSREELVGLFKDPWEHRIAPEQFSGLSLLVTRLAERNHDKMKYYFVPDSAEGDTDAVIVGYRQTSGAPLMDVDGAGVAPSGRAWADPNTGRILRIEEEFRHKTTLYSIEIHFAFDDRVGTSVPARILVRVFEKARLELQSDYTYSKYRRVAVDLSADGASANPPKE